MSTLTSTPPPAGQTQQLAPPKEKPKTIADLLMEKKGAMAAVATRHLTPEKLIKIVAVAMSRVPKLYQCTPLSTLSCVMTLAELGLAPGPLGAAYLIPYENRKAGTVECQLIIGYRGLLELARRSGFITTIQTELVREGDHFELEYDMTGAVFKHKPKSKPDAPITGAWALVNFKDGGHQFTYMTRQEIDFIRSQSKAGNNGPWVTHYGEMAKKTVLRRLCKLLPLTTEVEEAIAVADKTEFRFDQIASDPIGSADGEDAADNVGDAKSAVGAAASMLEGTTVPVAGDSQAKGEAVLEKMKNGGGAAETPAPGQSSLIPEGGTGTVDRSAGKGGRSK